MDLISLTNEDRLGNFDLKWVFNTNKLEMGLGLSTTVYKHEHKDIAEALFQKIFIEYTIGGFVRLDRIHRKIISLSFNSSFYEDHNTTTKICSFMKFLSEKLPNISFIITPSKVDRINANILEYMTKFTVQFIYGPLSERIQTVQITSCDNDPTFENMSIYRKIESEETKKKKKKD